MTRGSDPDAPIQPASAPGVFSLYWFENIAIILWHTQPTPEAPDALTALLVESRERFPSGISAIHIQHFTPKMLAAETRNGFARSIKAVHGHIIATAVVTHASGFMASTLQSMATGIVALARMRVDLRFHERPEEIIEWLPAKHEQHCGVKIDSVKLRAMLLRIDAMGVPDDPSARTNQA